MAATVLCVDDDRHLCRILEKTLAQEGYRVVTATDGEQGIRALKSDPPGLVLLDVLLPKKDGFKVLEEIRALDGPEGRTPVLMATGCRVTPQYEERAEKLGAAGILSKPVPLDLLLERVREHVVEPARRVAKRAGAAPKASGKPLKGNFQELDFPHLLHHLHGLRATGALMLANGKKRKAIQLRDGYPVAVQSNLVNECLGNMLLRKGKLGDAELKESLRRLKEGEGLQGEVLVAMAVLTEDEVVGALREQAEEKLFEVFGWRRGSFQFQIGGRLKRGHELAIDGSPANLILRGVRDYMQIERVDAYLRARAKGFPVRGESPFYRFQEIDVKPEVQGLVDSLDGTRQLKELLKAPESVRRTLFGLLASEMLDLRRDPTAGAKRRRPVKAAAETETEAAPPRPDPEADRELRAELAARAERLRGLSYFEVLEVDEDADAEAIDAAYEELARQTHPDRYSSSSSAVRQLANEVHQLVCRAHETLSDPRRRQKYAIERRRGERRAAQEAEGKRALEAEIEFQKGEANLRSRDYEIALRYFGEALKRNPEEGEYHAYYGWCLHLCHPDDAMIAQEAIEHAKSGVKLARDREKPYLFLGRLYKAVGKNAPAERMFTRAVQIRPDCVEALRELRLINLRREKSKGLVRRLLRR